MNQQEIEIAKERLRLQDEYNQSCEELRKAHSKYINAADKNDKIFHNMYRLEAHPEEYFKAKKFEQETQDKLERYFRIPVATNESLIEV